MRIKNWTSRQAFRKDRPPSWIRLYFDLLDNFEWHSLPPENAKVLIELWLLAAQHDPQGGSLPSIEKIAFLLRRDLTDTKRIVKELCGEWVTEDEKDVLQHGYQTVTERLPDGSTEIEIEIEIEKRRDNTLLIEKAETVDSPKQSRGVVVNDVFDTFWKAYPRKVNKPGALKAWKNKKLNDSIDIILAGLERWKASRQWVKDGGQFIPHPATWINQERWNDDVETDPTHGGDFDVGF
jgi:hypothetical protein